MGSFPTRCGVFVVIVLTSCLLYLLPRKVLYVLLLWTMASVPIGILVGHIIRDDEPEDGVH